MTERTTIRLPKPLLDAAKKRAAEEGRTVTSLLIEGLKQRLSEPKRKKKRIKMPRVCSESKKSKHPFPLVSLKLIEEQEDLERMQRVAAQVANAD